DASAPKLAGPQGMARSHCRIGFDRTVTKLLSKVRNQAARLEFSAGLPVRCILLCAQLDVVTMKNAAVFGCGSAGRRTYLHFRSKYRITTFLDNDKRQHGSRVLGVP